MLLVGSAATGTGFFASVLVLMVGIALGASALTRTVGRRGGSSARAILDERLARGAITPEDYLQRRAVLVERSPGETGVGTGRGRAGLAIVLVGAGLVGSVAFAAAGTSGGFGPMMGSHMMGWDGDGSGSGSAAPPVAGAREIRVVGDEYSFAPRVVRARSGETVNLRFENRGSLFHTLTISSLGFELRADGGETASGSLRVPGAKTYAIVCAVPGHTEAGMRARLEVTRAR